MRATRLQHGGLDGAVERGDAGRAPIGGHGVLGQIVGADAEEVGFGGEGGASSAAAGTSTMMPTSSDDGGATPAACKLGGRLVHHLPRAAQLVQRRDHREHDVDRAARARPQERAQLGL